MLLVYDKMGGDWKSNIFLRFFDRIVDIICWFENVKKFLGYFFLWYIKFFAKLKLSRIKPYIVGITGSVGKSSVRDAVALVLKDKYALKVTGKANSESGIPLDVLGLEMQDYSFIDWLRVFFLAPVYFFFKDEKYEKYIVEMGVDSPYEPKNMSYLLKILKPNAAIFINASAVHSEAFDKEVSEEDPQKRRELIIQKIAQEKGKLIESIEKDGFVIVNADDTNVMKMAKNCKGKIITVGSGNANVVFSDIGYDLGGFKCKFSLKYDGIEESALLHIKDQALGSHYALTFGLAIALGVTQGVDFKECVRALENYKTPPGRMSLIKGIENSYIIDSSYNASALSVLDALEVLRNLGKEKHKIAVIGDMRELGDEVEIEHKRVAEKLFEIADQIILVGPLTKNYVLNEVLQKGFPRENIHWFENSFLAKDFVKNIIKGEEIILVKGSQNQIFLERIVEEIMEDKSQADKLLCRRGQYWDKIRQKVK